MEQEIYRILGKRGRITIPYAIRQSIGFSYNDVLSFRQNGNAVTIKREKICDGCAKSIGSGHENINLSDFLNQLSPQMQKEALKYLLEKNNGGSK